MALFDYWLYSGRIIFGALFWTFGALKTATFGRAISAEGYSLMSGAVDDALHVVHLDKYFNQVYFQEAFGRIEMSCGFLLLSGQLLTLPAVTLMGSMSFIIYVLYAADSSLSTLWTAFCLLWGLFMLIVNTHLEAPDREGERILR